jgi:hypothetical protein
MHLHGIFTRWFIRPRQGMMLFLLLAVAGLSATMTYRIFWRGNLRAGGTIQPDGEARFDSLRIGTPKKPLDDSTPFFVRFSNGKAVASMDLTAGLIGSLATVEEKLPRNSEWGAAAVEYTFEGMVFVFREGRCVSFRANWIQLPNRSFRPELGSAQSGAFFRLPLTQEQLETLFGPPERIEDRSTL